MTLFTRETCETILSSGNRCSRPTKYAVNRVRACHRHLQRTIFEVGKPNETGHIFVTVYVWPAHAKDHPLPSGNATSDEVTS